ncbi:MAG: trehalose-phosphatase [Kiloniellaceae bacterium]
MRAPAKPPRAKTIDPRRFDAVLVGPEVAGTRAPARRDAAIRFLRRAKARGLKLALIAAGRSGPAAPDAVGMTELFDAKVDGLDRERPNIEGKPGPGLFLEAARRLGVRPERAVVIEDTPAGVEAAKVGRFGLVVGLDRERRHGALAQQGADIVVGALSELRIAGRNAVRSTEIPSALDALDGVATLIRDKQVAVFLDYDGTLTPIVERPDLAALPREMRATLAGLAEACTVAVVSGRSREDVAKLVGLDQLFYAGSHGFDIAGPDGREIHHKQGHNCVPVLRAAERDLRRRLARIDGALVEGKTFAVAVHYRLVAKAAVPLVRAAVDAVAAKHPELRKTGGKKVYELRPGMDWDKGKAVLWLLDALGLGGADVAPVYLGDDVTDEDAFAALKGRGIGICVSEAPQPTLADYRLRDPDEVRKFLQGLTAVLKKRRQ